MGKVILFDPRNGNKLYRYIGTAVSYIKQGKMEIASKYLASLPPQTRDQIVTTLTSSGLLNGKDISAQ